MVNHGKLATSLPIPFLLSLPGCSPAEPDPPRRQALRPSLGEQVVRSSGRRAASQARRAATAADHSAFGTGPLGTFAAGVTSDVLDALEREASRP
jgi:hypothetical protein